MKNKLNFEERQIRRRNKKVNELRFRQGIKEIFSKRSKLTLFSVYIIISIFIWILFIYDPNDYKNIVRLLVYILFWVIFSIFASGILMWFGKPKRAQEVEDDIKDVLKIEKDHKVPILVSIYKTRSNISTKINTYKFYSPDFSEDKYEEKRTNIEQKLGIKIVDGIESDQEFIYFDAISKKDIKSKGELKDDRI